MVTKIPPCSTKPSDHILYQLLSVLDVSIIYAAALEEGEAPMSPFSPLSDANHSPSVPLKPFLTATS